MSTARIVRNLEACRRTLVSALDAVDTGGTARRVAARRPAGPNGRIRGEGLDRLAARTAIAQVGIGGRVEPPREFFWTDDEMVEAVGLDADVAAKPDPDVPETRLPLPPRLPLAGSLRLGRSRPEDPVSNPFEP